MSTMEAEEFYPWTDKKTVESWLRTHYGELAVADLEVKPATGKGDNYLNNLTRIVVRTESGDRITLIVKCRMDSGKTATILKDSLVFIKEQEMYTNALPRMHALLQTLLPADAEPFGPRSVYVCEDFLVMEDLSAVGFKMAERREGMDLGHSLLVMRTLARFHAASAVLHQVDPSSMKEFTLSYYSDPPIADNWHNFYGGLSKAMAEELETWSEEWWKYADKLRRLEYIVMKRLQDITEMDVSGFNALNHVDLWVNNIMFRDKSVRFVDFQSSHFSSPTTDLLYFLNTSTTLDVRINHEDTLLKEYHTVLCDTLTVLGYSRKLISLQELMEDLDRKSFYGLYSTMIRLLMQSDPESGFSFDEVLTSGLTPGRSMLSENYKQFLKWFLPYCDRKGFWCVTPDLRVASCETGAAADKGDNLLSIMRRLGVRTETGCSHHLVVKCRPETGTAADIMAQSDIFRKERQMYSSTLPEIQKQLTGKCHSNNASTMLQKPASTTPGA